MLRKTPLLVLHLVIRIVKKEPIPSVPDWDLRFFFLMIPQFKFCSSLIRTKYPQAKFGVQNTLPTPFPSGLQSQKIINFWNIFINKISTLSPGLHKMYSRNFCSNRYTKKRDSMLGHDPISGAALHIVSNKFISGYSYICGSQCSCIVKDLLVCGGLISWVTDLLCFKCQLTINSLL